MYEDGKEICYNIKSLQYRTFLIDTKCICRLFFVQNLQDTKNKIFSGLKESRQR